MKTDSIIVLPEQVNPNKAYSSSEPIKVEYINGIKVGSRKFGFGGKVDEYTDKDYSEFLAKRFNRIISIDIYEKEESS
tara:strand:- start:72 stop:305 length:234 start_codon:yes stop_codon:yes gene_type:complete